MTHSDGSPISPGTEAAIKDWICADLYRPNPLYRAALGSQVQFDDYGVELGWAPDE